jgi:hypothetical protein
LCPRDDAARRNGPRRALVIADAKWRRIAPQGYFFLAFFFDFLKPTLPALGS